jgi:hypothetical protein
MKVKLFIHHNVEEVEKAFNEWMEKHSVQVCHITQSQSEKQGRFVFVLSVFFQPVQKQSFTVGQTEAQPVGFMDEAECVSTVN